MGTGARLEEIRGLEALVRRATLDALILTLFPSNPPSTIDPDDAAAIGVAPRYSREDHQHAFTSGAASSLALTASNSEGSSSSHARADHGHSTAALPWGVVGTPDVRTSDSSGFTAPGTADWLLDELVVDASRRYTINFISPWGITVATDRAIVSAHADGTEVARLGETDTVGAGSFNVMTARALWLPATGTPDIDIRITGLAGAGTFTFFRASTFPGQLWVEDVGPRP